MGEFLILLGDCSFTGPMSLSNPVRVRLEWSKT